MRHRRIAGTFGDVVAQVDDWDAPAPVDGWTARDVVSHLVTWPAEFLEHGGITLVRVVDEADPAATWVPHAAGIQSLLDSPEGAEGFTDAHVGTQPLGAMIDQIYTTDVLMHTWDLAEAAAVDSGLDADECAGLVEAMRPMEQMLRDSGQYGPAVAVPDDADGVTRLAGFIGRDPMWRTSHPLGE